MIKQCDDKSIPFGDIAKGLNQGVESADLLRTAGLTQLARVRAVKETQWQREQTRLQAKLGSEHQRVTAIATKIDANRELRRDVDLGISRAATPTVQPQENTWILHGYVRNKTRQSVPNLTVGLYDQKNQWIEELGYTCTDKNGYFQLSHARTKKESTDPLTTEKTAAGPQVFIHVLDKQGAPIHVDKRPLTPEPGRVDYREIILDEDATSCAPPGAAQPKPGRDTDKEKTGRYLGNANKRELHDLKNATPRCHVDEIKSEHRVVFRTEKEALAAGYDYCAFCFGKEKSKR